MAPPRILTPDVVKRLNYIAKADIPPQILAELESVIAHYQQIMFMQELLPKKRSKPPTSKPPDDHVEKGKDDEFALGPAMYSDDELKKLTRAALNLAAIIERRKSGEEKVLNETIMATNELVAKGSFAIGKWLGAVAENSASTSAGDKRKMKSLSIWADRMGKIIMNPSPPQRLVLDGERMSLIWLASEGLDGIARWLNQVAESANQLMKPGKAGRPAGINREQFVVQVGRLYYKMTNKVPGSSQPRKSRHWLEEEDQRTWGHSFIDFVQICLREAGDLSDGKPINASTIRSLVNKIKPQLRSLPFES